MVLMVSIQIKNHKRPSLKKMKKQGTDLETMCTQQKVSNRPVSKYIKNIYNEMLKK